MTIVPIFLMLLVFHILIENQRDKVIKNYGLDPSEHIGVTRLLDKVYLLNFYTMSEYDEISKHIREHNFAHHDFLEKDEWIMAEEKKLEEKFSFFVLESGDEIKYLGNESYRGILERKLSTTDGYGTNVDAVYIGDKNQPFLYKRIPFENPDGRGNLYIVTAVNVTLPHIRILLTHAMLFIIITVVAIAILVYTYTYLYLVKPIEELQESARAIGNGDFEHEIKAKGKNEFTALYEDMERMRLQIKSSVEELKEEQAMNREIIGNVSHDLRTPLTAVKGYSEAILDGIAASPEKIKQYVDTIHTKSIVMTGLVEELSFFTKINQKGVVYQFVEVNPDTYFQDCVSEMALDLDVKGITLVYQSVIEASTLCKIDLEKMKRVINNIIGNASKYINKSTGLIIFKLTEDENNVYIRVEDNGAGIEEEALPYIFERFYRTDRSRNSGTGGSGLGLSIVKKIIDDHDGEVYAESQLGIGTAINITLKKSKKEEKRA